MEKRIWNENLIEEIDFWDYWFSDKGLYWKEDYAFRQNPDTELQAELKALVSGIDNPRILDVGAGPLTFLGKNIDGKPAIIIPVDALADRYDKMLDKHEIIPLIRTLLWDSEDLANLPASHGLFNLITAQNTLDHSYDPIKAIMAMPLLLKPGGVIWLNHYINEAERGQYQGLHQWNFYEENGNLMLRTKTEAFNVTYLVKERHPECVMVTTTNELNQVISVIKFP